MVHACACCRLRFTSNGELADHVGQEHAEHPPFAEDKASVVRPRYPSPTWWGGVKRRASSS